MVAFKNRKPLFDLGRLLATPEAIEALAKAGQTSEQLLDRHVTGDFGDICEEDRELNLAAIQDGSRIMSVYHAGGVKLYIITEATDDDGRRSATTILRSDQY